MICVTKRRRNQKRRNKKRCTEHAGIAAKVDEASIEGVQKIASTPKVEQPYHAGDPEGVRDKREYHKDCENGRDQVAVCCRRGERWR